MKFTCPQESLDHHLSMAARAVSSRPSRPILSHLLVTADVDTQSVALVGFDEAIAIETRFVAVVSEGGTICLPAKLWGDIVARLATGDIEAVVNDATATMKTNSGTYDVRGLSAEDYPNLPTVEGEAFALAGDDLLTGLQGSLFAVSGDETKQVLTGVHLLSESDLLEFSSTDGHRLSVVQTADESGGDIPAIDITIPSKALREVERMVSSNAAAEVQVTVDDTQARLEIAGQVVTTRLLEGQYPNYRQLLPKAFARQVTVNRKALMLSLERVGVLASQKNDIIKISVASGDQMIALSVEASEVGTAREELPATVTGDDIDIAFNVRYLLDGLKAMDTNEVTMQCNAPTSPAVFVPVGGAKMTYLIMPVAIREP